MSRNCTTVPMVGLVVPLCMAATATLLTGCPSQPETPPCDAATLAQITATCPSEEECNRLLDERQSTCSKRIEADK